MKNILKKIIKFKLKNLAKIYLWRTKPEIIVITGVTNRLTFRNVIAENFKDQSLRVSSDNHNAEIGVPLSILGLKITKRSDWFLLMLNAVNQAWLGEKVDKIILEIAIDKPNDMDYLLNIITPKVVIITNIEPVYMDNFGTLDNIALEYKKLIKNVVRDGLIVLNNDDNRVADLKQYAEVEVETFSIDSVGDYQAQDILKIKNGQQFKLSDNEIKIDQFGSHNILAKLASLAIEKYYNL